MPARPPATVEQKVSSFRGFRGFDTSYAKSHPSYFVAEHSPPKPIYSVLFLRSKAARLDWTKGLNLIRPRRVSPLRRSLPSTSASIDVLLMTLPSDRSNAN